MGEYITIKEFAKRAGVSPQAIYQRIEKDLKPYFKEVDGKKTLDIKALDLFILKADDKHVDNELIKTLQETLKLLSNQLEVKDKQIAELNERLSEANELNRNNQILIGREQQPKQIASTSEEPIKKKFWDRFRKD